MPQVCLMTWTATESVMTLMMTWMVTVSITSTKPKIRRTTGTSPTNPDTDGDGVCDGPESPVTSNCIPGPDAFPLDPAGWEDTDGDGHPNELFPPSNSDPALTEDLDDDNDGWSDIDEVNCGSDPLNATDFPTDLNGDGICDSLDNDWDDDGIPNANETDTGVYNGSNDTGTDPWNPDTDGDGWCDGPVSVMNGSNTICVALVQTHSLMTRIYLLTPMVTVCQMSCLMDTLVL